MPVIIPAAIAAKIAEVESSAKVFDVYEISTLLDKLVGDAATLDEDERFGCLAEIVGLRFVPLRGEDRGPWDSYYGPIFSGTATDGSEVYGPDATAIPREVIEYWRARSDQSPHPTLRARYADLALEIGRIWNRHHPGEPAFDFPRELSQRSIDAHLKAVESGFSHSDHQAWIFLNRAMDLALRVHDAERVERTKRIAFAYCRDQRAADKSGYWWNLDDLVWDRKGLVLSDAERSELIAWLDEALTIHSDINDEKRFDPHQSQSAADRLQHWYDKLGQKELSIEAIKKAGAAFEAMADKANAITAIAWLEDLSMRYRHAKLTDDAARVDAAIKARGDEAEQEMVRHEIRYEIPKEKMDQWLDALFKESLGLSLGRIAAQLMHDEAYLRQMVEDSAANAPLHAHIPVSIMGSNGFKRATIGSVKDDMSGRIMNMAATLIGQSAPWLNVAFEHAKEKWKLDADQLFSLLAQSPHFPANSHGLLREGIAAWFAEDHVKAIHVLVPQVESALREWLSALGESPMRPDREAGGFKAIGMGEILSASVFKDETNVHPMLRLHLRALYIDAKGLNLRNRIAHGLVSPEILNRGTANWVIHSLLAVRTFAHLRA